MKRLSPLLSLLLFSSFIISCSKDKDPVMPKNVITSNQGLLIELDWDTGGSSSQALYESDLDLYLDLENRPVESSESLSDFESIHLRDVFRNGTYEVYIGAMDISRSTNYSLYVSAPGGGVIHRYNGYFEAGEEGQVRYLSIRKEGRNYTLTDL